MSETRGSSAWPPLPLEEWSDTAATLHLWMQIVGKVRLVQSPWINHSWHVTLYVTAYNVGALGAQAVLPASPPPGRRSLADFARKEVKWLPSHRRRPCPTTAVSSGTS